MTDDKLNDDILDQEKEILEEDMAETNNLENIENKENTEDTADVSREEDLIDQNVEEKVEETTAPFQEESPKKKIKVEKEESAIMEWAKSILVAVVLTLVIKTFILEPTRVQGTSMINTLHNNDRVIVNKIGMKIKPLKRGDVIVMKYDEGHDYIKRIIGMPGEYIQIIDGKVYLNGEELKEDYIHGDFTQAINGFEWKLAKNEYFVMGDNREPGGSTDSRVFGPVNIDRIKGVANIRFYPFDNIGEIN